MGALTIITTGVPAVFVTPTGGPSAHVWSSADLVTEVPLPEVISDRATFYLQNGTYTITLKDPDGTILYADSVTISASPSTVDIGRADPTTVQEHVAVIAASGASHRLPDPATAGVVRVTLTAACTFTFPAAKVGSSFTLLLTQGGSGSYTVTWPGTVLWPSATAPTLTTTVAKTDVFSFLCADGINWLGFTSGQAF
jgi:hypothetical protein